MATKIPEWKKLTQTQQAHFLMRVGKFPRGLKTIEDAYEQARLFALAGIPSLDGYWDFLEK